MARFICAHPTARDTVPVSIVIQRHHDLVQYIDERIAVSAVVNFGRDVGLTLTDSEAVSPVVGLGPPPVEGRTDSARR